MIYDHSGLESMDTAEFINNNGEFRVIKHDIYNLNKVDCTEENGFY